MSEPFPEEKTTIVEKPIGRGRPKGSKNKKQPDSSLTKFDCIIIKNVEYCISRRTKKQGRPLGELPESFESRSTYRQGYIAYTLEEMRAQTRAGIHSLTLEDGKIVSVKEKGKITGNHFSPNDLVVVTQTCDETETQKFKLASFCIIRTHHKTTFDRGQIDDDEFDSKTMHLISLNGMRPFDFKGEWYVHYIINLTTFERIYDALHRRGKLPLEKILLSATSKSQSDDKTLVLSDSELPIRSHKLSPGGQMEAICKVFANIKKKEIVSLWGPPGTGKTRTLTEILYVLSRIVKRGRTLVTGPANATVADLVTRIMEPQSEILPQGRYLMVVGHQSQLDPRSYPYAMFTYLSKTTKLMTSLYKTLLAYQKQLSKIATMTGRFDQYIESMKVLPCKPTKVIRLLKKLGKNWENYVPTQIMDDLGFMENMDIMGEIEGDSAQFVKTLDECIQEVMLWCYPKTLIPILVGKAQMICCTNSQAMSNVLKDWPFEYVLQDEAGQCIEMMSFLSLRPETRKLILVGDCLQLPGFVRSPEAKAGFYDRSLMKRLSNNNFPAIMLDQQHRMDRPLAHFPYNYIYDGKVKTADSIDDREPYAISNPYQLFNIVGSEHQSQQQSFYNLDEISAIVDWINNNAQLIPMTDISIITPYQAQCTHLRQALQKINGLTIHTIDAYQGQENKTVLLSLVRSGGNSIGFLSEKERMNVALTRAQRCFCIFGNLDHFAQKSPHWAALLASYDQYASSLDESVDSKNEG